MSVADVFLALIAVLFPPIAVWIKRGICSCDSIINILLCLLGYLPGLIHAWYIIAKYPEDEYSPIPSHEEHVVYYYVSSDGSRCPAQRGQPGAVRAPKPQAPGPSPQNYGTTTASTSAPPTGPAGPEEGSSQLGVPPTYAEAVKGDHKVQT